MSDDGRSNESGNAPDQEFESMDEDDPVLNAYLTLIERDMLEHPERIQPLDPSLLARIESLVGGMEIDLHENLGDEIELPDGNMNRSRPSDRD